MDNDLILIEEYCANCGADATFIHYLNELGLIEIVEIEQRFFLKDEQLSEVEKFKEWHYDLDISPAGIDTIQHLLHQLQTMRHEVALLRKRLSLFE